jgi:hypothetical protein
MNKIKNKIRKIKIRERIKKYRKSNLKKIIKNL